MKIGIVTWFKYENYGTILQAIALYKYLKNLNFIVELIDYRIDNKELLKRKITSCSLYYLKGKVIKKIYTKKNQKKLIEKSKSFEEIIEKNCTVSRIVKEESDYINLCNQYDILIFGSDQIWNPNWYHPYYFANYDEIKCFRIAYAPSFGVNLISKEEIKEIRKALYRFDAVAMREENGCKIIKDIINKEVNTVVDPTLLLNKNDWTKYEEEYRIKDKKYILCYFLSDIKNHWKAVKKFAKEKQLEVYVIPHIGHSFNINNNVIYDVKVGNFLYLIKNAEYVVTDSFHATIFSLIYEKKFVLFERHNPKKKDSQNSRLYNLLHMLKLDNELVLFNSKEIKNKYTVKYDEINLILRTKIENSKKFLCNSINNARKEE